MSASGGPRIVDPHVHFWDPRTTPREVTPLVKLLGWWPGALEWVARMATPAPLVDFVGTPEHVLGAHLPADIAASAGHHRVEGIVHIEAGWAGKGELGPVGETRWLDQLDSPPLGIVAHADLDDQRTLEKQLDGHAVASGRLRGVRDILAAHPDPRVHSWTEPDRIRGDGVRVGLMTLAEHRLTFDAWCYADQLPDLARLAGDVPTATVVLDHLGTPVGLGGPFGGQGTTEAERERIRDRWYAGLLDVAAHPNVRCKLSGLLMPICGFGFHDRPAGDPGPSVDEVVDALAPHLLFAIEHFGADRCLFASNFPMDKVSVDYATLWDAYLAIAGDAGLPPDAEAALFAANAEHLYRLVG